MIIPSLEYIVTLWKAGSIDKVTDTELCKLYQKFGSDKKGKPPQPEHNFPNFYINFFKPLKTEAINIFELGLGTNNTSLPSNMGANGKPGASLYAVEEYFPNANIFGADIDNQILFQTSRIKTYYCDQRDAESVKSMWNNTDLINKQMHFIIEDGLHTVEASYNFLINSLHKLTPGGIYFGEDQDTLDIISNFYENKITNIKREFNLSYFDFVVTNNCPIIVAQKNY
jgi:hypothetical protein